MPSEAITSPKMLRDEHRDVHYCPNCGYEEYSPSGVYHIHCPICDKQGWGKQDMGTLDFKKWARTINLKMLKQKCEGCKHEISCWTLYHDGLDCYEPKE